MSTPQESTILKKKLIAYKSIALILAIVIAIILAYRYIPLNHAAVNHQPINNATRPPQDAPPYYAKIIDIMKPLEYSGIQAIARPNVTLSINYANGTWTLHNLHQYDAQGNILLEENRYGLCGELASYVSSRLRAILSDRYKIKFANVSEAGFFLAPKATHIILLIDDQLKTRTSRLCR